MISLRFHSQRSYRSLIYNSSRSFFATTKYNSPRFRTSNPSPLNQHSLSNGSKLSPNEPTPFINTVRSRSLESLEKVSYVQPLIFGSVVCISAFVTAGIAYDRQQETIWQRWMARLQQRSDFLSSSSSPWWRPRFLGQHEEDRIRPTMVEIWEEKREMIVEKRQEWMDKVYARLQRWQQMYGLPEGIRRAGLILAGKFASMTESERTLAGLVGLNLLVFGAWQVPRWTPFMVRWFMHHPGAGSFGSITLVTSCFSHKEGLHLACNMVGLWSFGGLMHDYLGREQFLALYLSTGVGANMISHTLSLAFRRSRALLPSLGASGAIYGLLSGTAYLEPQASVSLIFLPFIPIKLGYALPAMMGFDVAGILLKWKMFDHYAHLAGASIGLGYLAYGQQHLWQPLVRNIHEIRTKQTSH